MITPMTVSTIAIIPRAMSGIRDPSRLEGDGDLGTGGKVGSVAVQVVTNVSNFRKEKALTLLRIFAMPKVLDLTLLRCESGM
jgi:hypothetical protein